MERTESDVQGQIVAYLKTAGWYVRQFSQDRGTRAQLAGWVDVFAARRGVVLLIECKTPKGKRRPKQVVFANEIAPHLWSTLRYVVARDLTDVVAACGDKCI